MKKAFFIITLILLFNKGLSFVKPTPIFSQQFSLEISPPLVEITTRPGTTITQTYQIKNKSSQKLILRTHLEPFSPSHQGLPSYPATTSPFSPQFSFGNSDLKLNQDFLLPSQASQQIILKIKTASDTIQKDYYYTLFFAQNQDSQSSAFTTGQIGTNLLITVSDTPLPPLKPHISSFSVHPRLVDLFFKNIRFQGIIENQGSTFFKPQGQIEILRTWPPPAKDSPPTLQSPLIIRPDNILAQSSRSLSCISPDSSSVPCKLSQYLPPGHYQATLRFCPQDYPPEKNDYCRQKTITFFVLPYLLIIITVILFPVYLIFKKK